MKKLLILLSLFASLNMMAQDYADFSIGLNLNRYYKTPWTSGLNFFNNSVGQGVSLLYGKEYYRNGKNKFRFSIGIETIGGDVKSSYHGRGFDDDPQYDVHKTIVTLSAYPLNFHFWKYVDLNIGMTGTIFVRDNSTVKYWVWNQGDPYAKTEPIKFSALGSIGFSTRLSTRFPLNEKFMLVPQYSFYLGVFNELRPGRYNVSAMRHTFGVGLQYALNSTINCVPSSESDL